jgi:succinate dehydrogenase/fumarate reductase flavoprotein subunit
MVDGRYKFWGGMVLSIVDGGKGLVAQYTEAATRAQVEIRYSTSLTSLIVSSGRVVGVKLNHEPVYSSAVILCCGGFEASPRLRAQYLGPNWDLSHVRGTPYNTGDGLEICLRDVNAKFVGNWSACHSVAWDAKSLPNSGSRKFTNQYTKSGYPLGVMVNSEGERFVDEGIDMRNFTYAKFGKEILKQPGCFAFQIWDKTGVEWLRPEEYGDDIVTKISADTIEELAEKLIPEGLIDQTAFLRTVQEYNDAITTHRNEYPGLRFDPSVKDGLSTQSSHGGLPLAKSNWALPIKDGPFVAVKVTCGITFTFGGVAVNPRNAAVVSNADGKDIPGLWAAGEIVGGCFYGNYPVRFASARLTDRVAVDLQSARYWEGKRGRTLLYSLELSKTPPTSKVPKTGLYA